jgi:uncharacterized membrane protein YGL010W
MSRLVDRLAFYAEFHRDTRNILTHFVGVPMIVLGVMVLLTKPGFILVDQPVTPLHLALLPALAYYFRLHWQAGLLMVAVLLPMAWAALWIGALGFWVWLASAVGLFVVGWAIQFLGHHYEGRKPAFVDDLSGLILGPLFVTVEALFMLGLWRTLKQAIEAKAGPTR